MQQSCIICLDDVTIPYKQALCNKSCSSMTYHHYCWTQMKASLNIECAICKYITITDSRIDNIGFYFDINEFNLYNQLVIKACCYGTGVIVFPVLLCFGIILKINDYTSDTINYTLNYMQNIADNILTY